MRVFKDSLELGNASGIQYIYHKTGWPVKGLFTLTFALATWSLLELHSIISTVDLVVCPQFRYTILHQMRFFSQLHKWP